MKTSTIIWIIVVLIIILGGGWYWYSSMSTAAPATGPTTDSTGSGQAGTEPQPAATSVIGSNLALGTDSNAKVGGSYLIGYNGMTVYTYSPDTGTSSTCYGACATNWPPYVISPTDNINQLQAGVTGSVGTTARTDGQLQLTYNGHPLYFYIGDKTGSDVNGQGIGGIWYVVKP